MDLPRIHLLAIENRGIDKIWSVVETYRKITRQSGGFDAHRKKQAMLWVDSMENEHLRILFTGNPNVSKVYGKIEEAVENGSGEPVDPGL